jgi:dienelactone hydrolase
MLRTYFVLLAVLASVAVSAQNRPMSSYLPSSYPSSYPSDADSDKEALPLRDQRATNPPHTLDTPRVFPHLASRAEWEARRARLRQQVLVSCGLYPLPPKTPLKPRIFDRVERDGYTIEKVYFQTYPGFYLAGNLYRPLKGKTLKGKEGIQDTRYKAQEQNASSHSPYPSSLSPGILIAHGHWNDGRMADGPDGSIAARAITFARQGCVAFTYDMVGYNDTRQIPQHLTFAADRQSWLWGVSLMGLQTWNSVRALDFLATLPDVDRSRLAITGESGGGTQTMMLGAIDDRLAAVGPCVMVSHSMQGGCLCENAPGLRVDNSNMEIAAVPAPRPQIMVGATGDWTKTMMTIEGPGVQSVYDLYNQSDSLKYVIYPFNHNINKTSREAVYQFFGTKLLHDPSADTFTEPPYQREPVADLRVFPDDKPLPADAKTADQLTQYLKDLGRTQLEKAKPHDKRSLTLFKKTFQPAWERTLSVERPAGDSLLHASASPSGKENVAKGADDHSLTFHTFGRRGRGDAIPVALLAPRDNNGSIVVLVHPRGRAALLDNNNKPNAFVQALLTKGKIVAIPDVFLTGISADAAASEARRKALNDFGEFFTTYNRTDAQERVQDILTVCDGVRKFSKQGVLSRLSLVGMEQAGAWVMLAAPTADAVAADVAQLDLTNDDALLAPELYIPCLRRMGDFRTALTLAAPHPLLLHNTGAKFTASAWVQEVYNSLGSAPTFKATPERLTDEALTAWLTH